VKHRSRMRIPSFSHHVANKYLKFLVDLLEVYVNHRR
jgi:hypothetical protein